MRQIAFTLFDQSSNSVSTSETSENSLKLTKMKGKLLPRVDIKFSDIQKANFSKTRFCGRKDLTTNTGDDVGEEGGFNGDKHELNKVFSFEERINILHLS